MREPLHLQIPKPCHENWAEMKPDEKGRFCLSCQKIVVDFSSMTDRQVLEYFSNYAGNTCGRFSDDQLNRDIVIGVQKPTAWYKYVLSLIVPAVMLANKAMTQGDTVVQRTTETTTKAKVAIDSVPNFARPVTPPVLEQALMGRVGGVQIWVASIEGKVTDEYGIPVPNAIVTIKGTNDKSITDDEGKFIVRVGSAKKVTLEISALGLQSKEFSVKVGDRSKTPFVLVSLERSFLGEVLVIHRKSKPTIFHKFNRIIADSISSKKTLVLYPNTARPGSEVSVSLKLDKGRYLIRVINTIGQTMQEDIVNVAGKTSNTSFRLHNKINAGQYAVVVIDNKGKMVTSGQLIVQ